MDFFEIVKMLLKSLLQVLNIFKPIFFILIILILIIIIQFIINIFYFRIIKGIKPKKKHNNYYFTYQEKKYVLERPYIEIEEKEPSFIKKIFYLFPRQLAYDNLMKDPNEFNEYGIHIVVGEQGSGKSMTTVYLLEKWKKKYHRAIINTNMGYKYEDNELISWKQLITIKNDKYGVINVIDDLKAWWSNKDSKDLPPEVLAEICQQRKQRKAIIGTIQVFSEAPKPLRSQTHYIYVPITIAGCLTIVRITKAKYYDIENDRFKKYCGNFVFVHNKRLREAYDTYKKIEKYKDIEFATSEYFKST